MKLATDQLAQRLGSALGAGVVFCDAAQLAAHKIDGKLPSLLCLPADREQLSAALRLCSEAKAAVIPWGGGAAMALGNPPRRADVVIATERLNRVIDHDPANLTVTVDSGISLARLQQHLAAQRQFVPFDPPFAERATVGGIIAANLNSPRRSAYGSVRDLVIGMKVSLISGTEIKAGGKVVKNVAGYDMCKLFVGSLGTLGIITEATLRLAPVPESVMTVIATGTLAQARQFADALRRSSLLPAAAFLLNRPATEEWRVAVWCEGFTETVARYRGDLAVLAVEAGMNAQFLSGDEHSDFWRSIQNLPLQSERLVFRVTVPRGAIFDAAETQRHCPEPTISADALNGAIWLVCDPTKAALRCFADLSSMALAHRGHAVLFAAPSEFKHGLEVWGESPAAISLMRGIKQQFDPDDLLNPGRFVGGI